MTTNNAISKLTKSGFSVEVENHAGNQTTIIARKAGLSRFVWMTAQAGTVCVIKTVPVKDESDILTDYFPGTFWNTLAKALKNAA